jgi:hypothetical protein
MSNVTCNGFIIFIGIQLWVRYLSRKGTYGQTAIKRTG